MAYPWNVVTVPSKTPRRLAWCYFFLLVAGFLVYVVFLSYKAYALSKTPVVAIRYDRASALQLPYIAMCFNDLDDSQVGFTVVSPAHTNQSFDPDTYATIPPYQDSPGRCVVTGGSPVDPASFELEAWKLPREGQSKQLDTSTSCRQPGGIGLDRKLPISIAYAENASCAIETFQFTNRAGNCSDCFGFPLSDYQIDQANGSASIYLKLVSSCGASPSGSTPCDLPVGVYLIEPEDVPLARNNRFDEVISRTTSIAAVLRTSYRVILNNRVTFQYQGAVGRKRTSHFQMPAIRQIAIEDTKAALTYGSPTIYYVALELVADGYGIEMIQQVNPWLALPSSIGGAWNLVTLIFSLLFVSAVPLSAAPDLTWVNRAWFSREVWGPLKAKMQSCCGLCRRRGRSKKPVLPIVNGAEESKHDRLVAKEEAPSGSLD